MEGAYEHLATKADLEKLRADLQGSINSMMRWVVLMYFATIGIVIGIVEFLR